MFNSKSAGDTQDSLPGSALTRPSQKPSMASAEGRPIEQMTPKLRVVPCSLRKANDFVEIFHRHNLRTSRDGGKFAVAVAADSDVVGVAIVGNPLSATLMDGLTAEVLRACVRPDAPRNCNSLLYGACRRIWFEMGGRRILTYTLTEESGASLRGAGWTLVATIKGHDTTTWGKHDHLRRREQAILGQSKRRWEAINPTAVDLPVHWPERVSEIHEGPMFLGAKP
jgi:hypothetical protein